MRGIEDAVLYRLLNGSDLPIVIFLAGPPRAGKDTLARELMRVDGYRSVGRVEKMAGLLDAMTRPFFPTDLAFQLYRETLKDAPCPFLNGQSLRSWYQYLSEEVIKPKLGPDAFGKSLLERVREDLAQGRVIIVSDSGFACEARPIIEHVGVGNCVQVRIERRGCSFRGDTRGWWTLPGLRTVRVRNRPGAGPDFELILQRSPAVALN